MKTVLKKLLRAILPERIRKAIFHLGFDIARPQFDLFAYRYGKAPNMFLGLSDIQRRGFAAKTVVDVGAFHGQWSKGVRGVWPEAQLLLFEPNRELWDLVEEVASEINATAFHDLLGATDGETVNFCVMESGSSVFEENSSVPREHQTRTLASLDTVLSHIDAIDLLKIDAQGYELEILKGAGRLLQTTQAVLLEISLIEINRGAPLFHEVIAFMQARGFVAYEILEIHRRPLDGAMNQVDVFFVKHDCSLRQDRRHC